eukprot:766114-Hanusia_phi.AAC.3
MPVRFMSNSKLATRKPFALFYFRPNNEPALELDIIQPNGMQCKHPKRVSTAQLYQVFQDDTERQFKKSHALAFQIDQQGPILRGVNQFLRVVKLYGKADKHYKQWEDFMSLTWNQLHPKRPGQMGKMDFDDWVCNIKAAHQVIGDSQFYIPQANYIVPKWVQYRPAGKPDKLIRIYNQQGLEVDRTFFQGLYEVDCLRQERPLVGFRKLFHADSCGMQVYAVDYDAGTAMQYSGGEIEEMDAEWTSCDTPYVPHVNYIDYEEIKHEWQLEPVFVNRMRFVYYPEF